MPTNRSRHHDSFQQRPGSINTGRVLTTTTGNAQAFPERSKVELTISRYPEPSIFLDSVENHQAPISRKPPVTSQSIDRRDIVFKRLRQRLKLCQQYQEHPEYKRYRERERKDVDKQNKKVIWTDEMEEAFSNALVNIPPMGRRKKSQRGRAFGRNELISEWILHETGEERTRKQISSHIQVFDKIFTNFSEWRHLSRGQGEQSVMDLDTHEYYNNSVEEMVRCWPALRNALMESLGTSSCTPVASPRVKADDSFGDRHQLEKLEFEMWIGPSANVDKHLHDFTTLLKSSPTIGQMQLEELENWRCDYPDLELEIHDFDSTGSCEIVMINSSFHMMDDFPTDQLKLGINFLMEFSNPLCIGDHQRGCMETFSCVTRMYQDGKFLRQTEENACQIIGPGKVKPPFESKWWAREFVRLTERCGMAKDSGSAALMANATDMCTRFFQGLTMMQQIFAAPSAVVPADTKPGHLKHKQKAAILLWKFEQASLNMDASTRWHKLIPFPSQRTANSPSSTLGINMPPLNLDTALNLVDHRLVGIHQNFQLNSMGENETWYSSEEEEELCQDGFMFPGLHNEEILNLESQPTFEHDAKAKDENYISNGFGHFSQCIVPTQSGTFADDAYQSHPTPEIFGSQSLNHQSMASTQLSLMDSRRFLNGGSPGRSKSTYHRQPFNAFDTSTHVMLQTQLNMDDTACKTVREGQQDGVFFANSRQISCQQNIAPTRIIGNVNVMVNENEMPICDDGLKEEDMARKGDVHVYRDFHVQQKPQFAAPIPIRPQLQQFHSFAGILTTEDSTFDSPRRSFARMLDCVGDDMSEAFEEQNFSTIESVVRAHSQPPPLIRESVAMTFGHGVISNQDWTNIQIEEQTT